MEIATEASSKFDVAKLFAQAFSYLKHLRLMAIMLALGLLTGVCYFTYSPALYQAQSVVFIQGFGSSLRNSELSETNSYPASMIRSAMVRLQSQEVKIGAARRLGLVGDLATFEDVIDHVPAVRVGVLDSKNFEVTVLAYEPEIVRQYAKALVDEFQHLQESSWTEFRNEALDRYALQLRGLEEKINEEVDSISEMEREQRFTEASIEQQSLLDIPKEIVETRERIARMDSISNSLERYESESATTDNILSILSLLSRFEEDTEVNVGTVITKNSSRGIPTLSPNSTTEVVVPEDVDGLEAWRDLEKEKRLIEAEITEASKTFLPGHPKMKDLEERLEESERGLLAELTILRKKFDLEYERLKEKQTQLEQRVPEFQRVSDEFGKSAQTYKKIEQSQTMWDGARKRLSEKINALAFMEDFDWVQLRFKGHTSLRDQDPVSPNKKKLALMGLLLGIAGAIGLPTLLNLLDSSAKSIHQMEDYLGIRGIGIVPLTDPDYLESVHRSPAQGSTIPNYLLECFRVIRANIGLDPKIVSGGALSQVILVTSARPQEGKTTQAANLAWAFHSMGERVLLIDCDLRRGRVHGLLKLDNSQGMSRMLVSEVSPDEAICNTEQENFKAIPRGPIIPGSTELLCQEHFSELIQKFRQSFDRIILDCPPVLGLSESSSLQRLADGVVLVIRSEKTSAKDVRDAATLLRKIGAHFYGFVLNNVDLTKVGNYYQYYYYSAPYYDQFDADVEELV